jgi:hypothetical protein
MNRRVAVFAVVAVVSVLLAAGYVGWAAVREGAPARDRVPTAAERAAIGAVARRPHVVFQDVGLDADYAHAALAPRRDLGGRVISPLVCERVHFAGGRGICLYPRRGGIGWKFHVKIFDSNFTVRRTLTLSGLITRTRVSPDGRYGAVTSFVNGHSYAELGEFSTKTTLLDLRNGRRLADLEEFEVRRDGRRVEEPDFNFWGVTFARESNRFYATLASRGQIHLVEGDLAARRMRILRDDVECPSLSPDNTRLAFKKRVKDGWRLHVLDLATGVETALAETRSVDDQAEWLDDRNVLYGLDAAVRVVRADGRGAPRTLLEDALSPAVVHTATSALATPAASPAGA